MTFQEWVNRENQRVMFEREAKLWVAFDQYEPRDEDHRREEMLQAAEDEADQWRIAGRS